MNDPLGTEHKGETNCRNRWFSGGCLVAIGIILLCKNYGMAVPFPERWWALFIMIPSVGSFSKVWGIYSRMKKFSRDMIRPLIVGISIASIALTLMFGLPLEKIWPIWLILGGIFIMLHKIN